MKQLALLICVCALFSLAAQTQSIGIHAGTNISTFEGPVDTYPVHSPGFFQEVEPQIRFQGGATLQFDINRFMSLNTGVDYVQRGGKYTTSLSYSIDEFEYHSSFEFTSDIFTQSLEIPLSIRLNLKKEHFTFYAGAGASASVGLSAKSEYTWTNSESSMGFSHSFSESGSEELTYGSRNGNDLEEFSVGTISSVGVQWKRIILDMSYFYGLEDISMMRFVDLKPRSFALSLGMILVEDKG